MAVFVDKTGKAVMPVLDDDGAMQVAVDDEGGDNLPDLLKHLIWEMREMRRVYCNDKRMAFREYRNQPDIRSDRP